MSKRCVWGCELPLSFSSPARAGIWQHPVVLLSTLTGKIPQWVHEWFWISSVPGDKSTPSSQLTLWLNLSKNKIIFVVKQGRNLLPSLKIRLLAIALDIKRSQVKPNFSLILFQLKFSIYQWNTFLIAYSHYMGFQDVFDTLETKVKVNKHNLSPECHCQWSVILSYLTQEYVHFEFQSEVQI